MPAQQADGGCLRVAAVLVAALLGNPAWAQSAYEYFQVVDRDSDGQLSLREYQDWMSRAFHHMDGNHDGVLEPDEQRVPHARTVTLADLQQRLALQFARQDRNHDGWLSAKEYLAPPQ